MSVHSFWLVSDLSELTIGCFPLVLLGVVLGPTIFAVTSGYSVSEKVLLVREWRLLADRESNMDVNRLNVDCFLHASCNGIQRALL